jgi:hypothetical protein
MNPAHTSPSYFSKIYYNIFSNLRLFLPFDLFPYGFPTKTLYAFSFFFPCVIHALPIPSFLTSSFQLYLMKSTSYEAHHYAFFSNLLLSHSSWVKIFSAAPCSRTSLVYVLPEISFTRHHRHLRLRTTDLFTLNIHSSLEPFNWRSVRYGPDSDFCFISSCVHTIRVL